MSFCYLSGFGNTFASEAIENTLPKVFAFSLLISIEAPLGLYCEQVSGTAFTAPRHSNKFSWLYRIRPSVMHQVNLVFDTRFCWKGKISSEEEYHTEPNQVRWSPAPYPSRRTDFLSGVNCVARGGETEAFSKGCDIYLYAFTSNMKGYFSNRDGDLLFVPQEGKLTVKTEFGCFEVEPCEIFVIPRGIVFQVLLNGNEKARGYMLELHESCFELPELGPLGANGLANKRDFKYPVSWFENSETEDKLVIKFTAKFYSCDLKHSPFDVVAWHGNYLPYKYDLRNFCVVNSVSFDHLDPSIFTVLTAQSTTPGVAIVDFVIFPPRWIVQEHTFRPPWFHRNILSEYMGLIWGEYDAKKNSKENGFFPGGGSLHQIFSPHGPDKETYDKAVKEVLTPKFFNEGLAFMFETSYVLKLSPFAKNASFRQVNYHKCWENLDQDARYQKAFRKQASKL